MATQSRPVNHNFVFAFLVMLVLISVGVSLLHLSALMNNLVVIGVALVMSALVVAQYMGLRFEGRLVIWSFALPLILFAILVIAMMPDIGHVSVPFGGNPH